MHLAIETHNFPWKLTQPNRLAARSSELRAGWLFNLKGGSNFTQTIQINY